MDNVNNFRDYASYKSIRTIPYDVINYLAINCPNLWKLLKYENPMGKSDLSQEEIKGMIAPSSMHLENYNVAFQKFSDEAMTSDKGEVFSQLRIQVLNGYSQDTQVAKVNILLQIIVNNRKMICDTDQVVYDNRATAIMQELVDALNGKPLYDNGRYLFLNGLEDYSGGFKLVNFNNEYSGYNLIMTTIVSD